MPIIGNLHAFRSKPLQFLIKSARTYGDLVYFRLGRQHVYLVNHPDFIREVLVSNQANFTKSRALERAKILLGEGLLTSEGREHTRQRRLVQPAFHRERLAGYAQMMSDYAVRLRERWTPGASIEVSQEMTRLTLSIVGKTLFSADIEAAASEIGEAMTTVLKMFRMLMMPFSEYLERLPLPSMRRFEKARTHLNTTIYSLIRERRESHADTGDLLSMLLLARDEETGGAQMSDTQVRDEALTLLLAGHETTAQALTWTWYLLSQNPECERLMHDEIDSVLNGRAPTFDDVPRLRYTEMIFAEALRLYPPAWAIGRRSIQEFRLDSRTIPGRSICILSPYVVHRDPRWFPDPERFDPQRWTAEARESRPKFSYFPFGGGARVCIGERFAWMEGVVVLAAIAQKWKLRLMEPRQVEPLALITLRPKHGIRMIVEPREPARRRFPAASMEDRTARTLPERPAPTAGPR